MIFPVLYCFRKPQKKRKSTFIGDFTMSYALKNNRKFIGIEIEKTYFEAAAKRIEGEENKND